MNEACELAGASDHGSSGDCGSDTASDISRALCADVLHDSQSVLFASNLILSFVAHLVFRMRCSHRGVAAGGACCDVACRPSLSSDVGASVCC